MHPFEKAYTRETEAITLEGVTFHVELPINHNRFNRAVMSEAVEITETETKRKDLSPAQMVEVQIEAFVRTCVKRVDGWDGYTVEKLLSLPDACEALWDKARELADNKAAEAEDAVKKSAPISDGLMNGPDGVTSIKPSKAVEG